MSESANYKSMRVLTLYDRLQKGQYLNKSELAQEFGVNERSIQRDIEALRDFLATHQPTQAVVYDKRTNGYFLGQKDNKHLTNSEILAVCKILLESRSLRQDEMLPILDKLVTCCVAEANKKAVQELLANEKFHYVAPHHNQRILENLWQLGQAVWNRQVLEITYERLKQPRLQTRLIEPVGLLFSEYYFYLAAFLRNIDRQAEFDNPNDTYPTIFRVDRIRSCRMLDEHFYLPYSDRFEEGEFRKRIQFMFGGKLQRVRFRYVAPSVEAVLDRLPTAHVLSQDNDGWLIEAEVFGKGIEMWLRSQGDLVSEVKYTEL